MIELTLKGRNYKDYILNIALSSDYCTQLRRLFNIKFTEVRTSKVCETKQEIMALIDTSMNWIAVCNAVEDETVTEITIPSHNMESILSFIQSDNLPEYCESVGFNSEDDKNFLDDFTKTVQLVA